MDKLEKEVCKNRGEKIITGDFYAKSTAWNSTKEYRK